MRKILVVEDEDAIREVVALNLRLAGYEVTEAASAEQALAVFSPSAGFDVAVLDIMLPGTVFPCVRPSGGTARPSASSCSVQKRWRRIRSKASPSARTII